MLSKIPHSKPTISNEDLKAVSVQVASKMHATSSKTKEFEEKLSSFIDVKFAKATNSGTNSLYLSLLALGIKKGDEVIIPSYVCQSLLNAVNYTGAKPVLADIQKNFMEKGCNISAKTIKPLITKKTKAIIVPHMFGIPAKIDEIVKFGIPVIEDCAQSLGAEFNGKKLGSLGKIGIFSFYATKIISTGQGGMILTNSEEIKNKVNDLTTYDQREKYDVAYNFGLTDIQSSLGIVQISHLNDFIKIRKQIAEKYNDAFKNLPLDLIKYPKGSIPFRYVIKLKNKIQREKLQEFLKNKNIIAEQPVFKPLHEYLNLNKSKFKNTMEAHETILSLPIYPSLKQEESERIILSTKKFFEV